MADTTRALGTMSVLFTDVVGSTELRAEMGDDAADALQRVHDELVAHAVAQANGTVIKGLGDGTMASFPSAADAVSAAVTVQQAVDRHARTGPGRAFQLRVGISVGDVTVDGGDVHGTPVVEASRLCAAATGGEILVAELVRMMSRGRGTFVFEPVGDLELKGLPEPVPACRVGWEALADPDAPSDVPAPTELLGPQPTPYVGRPLLLDTLVTTWKEAAAGGLRTILLAGEPGIGKTRTAAEVGRLAHGNGAVLLYGRSDEEMAAPYQPFVEALSWYARHTGEGARLGRLPGELVRLLPDLPSLVPGVGSPVASDVRSEEHRLFEAVASWLVDASSSSGLVLVLDDLHWASQPTLQMLLHLLRGAQGEADVRLLVLGTYRDTDVDRAHPLADLVADLRRLPSVERILVDGLSAEEVIEFAEQAAGHQIDEPLQALARAVHAETEGNPFFVGEVLRHLVETGGVRRVEDRWTTREGIEHEVPEGVRDVVGRRVSRLSEDANAVLSVAAVVGREVDVKVVAAVSDLDDDTVIDSFDEGVRARLLEETEADRYRFAHALVRTTLYEELSATRRRRLHRKVLEALEAARSDDLVALAHHAIQAGPSGEEIGRAARHAIAAGEAGLAGRALADAQHWFCQALELLEEDQEHEEHAVEASCGLGEAQRDQGDASYRETLLAAARRAATLERTDLLVRAVLNNQRGYASIIGGVDEERVALIEVALDAVDPEPSAVRAQLLALLAQEVTFSDDHQRRFRLADEAEAMARALSDGPLIAQVLVRTGFAAMRGGDWDRYTARCEEAVALADAAGDPNLGAMARMWHSGCLMASGLIAQSKAVIEEMLAAAEEASPSMVWLTDAQKLRHTIGVEPNTRALERVDEMRRVGEELGEPDRDNWWAAGMSPLHHLSMGTFAALLELVRVYADQFPGTPVWRLGEIWALTDAGRIDEARAKLAEHRFDPERLVDEPWPFWCAYQIAVIAWRVRDADLAARVLAVLSPHRDRWAHYFLVTFGPLLLPLALCEATLGNLDEAIETYEEGLSVTRAAGYGVLADAMSLLLAEMLRARNAAGDPDRLRAIRDDLASRVEVTGAEGLLDHFS